MCQCSLSRLLSRGQRGGGFSALKQQQQSTSSSAWGSLPHRPRTLEIWWVLRRGLHRCLRRLALPATAGRKAKPPPPRAVCAGSCGCSIAPLSPHLALAPRTLLSTSPLLNLPGEAINNVLYTHWDIGTKDIVLACKGGERVNKGQTSNRVAVLERTGSAQRNSAKRLQVWIT